MKKYFAVCVVTFACVGTLFAQIEMNNPLAQKKSLLEIPMVHITSVSSLFVPVHIDTIKPFVVSLGPIVFGKHESAACDYFKQLKSTLLLNAERANAATANFAAASKGGSFKKNYHLPDHNDYSGISFYRIKQRNRDTGVIYSNIVAIKGVEVLPFRVYPNPASDKLWIDVAPKQSGNFAIEVYDLAGKLLHQQSASCTQNKHVVQSINISKLTAGLYQVKILLPDKTFLTGRFIKE
jgi:hypothetical protein